MKKFKKIKEFSKKIIFKLAENSLLVLVVLILITFLLGGLMFYKYSFLAEKKTPQIAPKSLKFKEDLYQKILETWQLRQKKFDEADLKEYPDLFQPVISLPETLTE